MCGRLVRAALLLSLALALLSSHLTQPQHRPHPLLVAALAVRQAGLMVELRELPLRHERGGHWAQAGAAAPWRGCVPAVQHCAAKK